MTIVKKHESIGKYYICMEIAFRYGMEFYEVSMSWNGRTLKSNVYGIGEKKNALSCFYRYKKKAKNG